MNINLSLKYWEKHRKRAFSIIFAIAVSMAALTCAAFLARSVSVANNPEILLCDEPTGNLDKESGNHVIEMLCKAQRKFGKTVIVVTHDNDIANRADRIIRIADGEIIKA